MTIISSPLLNPDYLMYVNSSWANLVTWTDRTLLQLTSSCHLAKEVAKPQKFTNKKVAAGQIKVKGLPDDVLPLQHPSHYGDRRLKAFLKYWEIKVQNVKAILAQRKRRDIQQYLVEWEGYTREEATWEPKMNIPEEIINFLWKI